MSDRPPLPATDNPFELLGVDPGASERDLKRAYVRLIKIYRPERDPEAFQRIQAAYEAATESGWLFQAPDDSDEDELDEPSAEACDEPESWPDPSPPENPVLDEIERFIEAGDLAAALERSKAIEDSLDPILDEHTEYRLIRIACAVIWFQPALAEVIYERAGGDPGAGHGFFHDLYDELRAGVSAGLTLWRPPPLSRLLAAAPVVDDTRVICRDLLADLYRAPADYIRAVRDLSNSPELFRVAMMCLDGHDAQEPASQPAFVVDEAIRWVDGAISRRTRFPLKNGFTIVALYFSAHAAMVAGPWVLLIAGPLVALWFWLQLGKDDGMTYPSVVRPWLLDVVLRYQLSPDAIAERIDNTPLPSNRIARYEDHVRHDPQANLLWRLIAVGRAALGAQASDG